jgi:glycosyltransferase involved in cell wall biosynthesis
MSKILFLTRLYDPHIGGVEKHVKKLSKELVKKGHKVVVVTTAHNKNLPKKETKNGVKVQRFKQRDIKFIGLLETWMWLVKNRSLIKKSDIVHCHDVFLWYLPFKIAYPRKKVYSTFHGWEGKYPIPFINLYLRKLAANLSTKNICIGEYIEKYYKIKANSIVYGAVDVSKSSNNKYPKSILYVGRLEEDNALEVILDAFEKLDGYTIEFCGDGSLADRCKRAGKIHGFVDPGKYIKRAKYVFVGGYLSILEAFSNECVVFAAYENDLKKDFFKMTPFHQWIQVSDNPNRLVQRLQELEKKTRLCSKIASRSYEWVKGESWEKLLDTYLDLWQILN